MSKWPCLAVTAAGLSIGLLSSRPIVLPGRHVTDRQMRLSANLRFCNHSGALDVKEGRSSTSAAYRARKDLGFPAKEGASRTTPSRSLRRCLSHCTKSSSMLKAAPFGPIAVFEELCRRHPDLSAGTRR